MIEFHNFPDACGDAGESQKEVSEMISVEVFPLGEYSGEIRMGKLMHGVGLAA